MGVYKSAMEAEFGGSPTDASPDSAPKELPDVLEYIMYMEGQTPVELHLKREYFMGLPETHVQDKSGKIVAVPDMDDPSQEIAFYRDTNGHGSFGCVRQETNQGDVYCKLAALFDIGKETCYMGPGAYMADCTDNKPGGELKYFDMSTDGNTDWKSAKTATVGDEARKRRATSPTQENLHSQAFNRSRRASLTDPAVKVVEVAFMVDAKFMELFYERYPDDVTAAQNEARMYVTLLATEMNVYFASVAEVTDGALEIYAYPADVIIPTKGYDFSWALTHSDGTYLYTSSASDYTLRMTVNSGFITKQWDHVMALTGLDLYDVEDRSSSLLGYAYRSTVCFPSWHYYSAYKYSINEVKDYNIGRIAAHELGHALGMSHDGDGNNCPEQTNLMSPSIFRVYARTSKTYSKFSTCSVASLENHLSSSPKCTTDNGFSQTQFTEFLCSELPGTEDTSLDKQCQLTTGWTGSTACRTLTGNRDCHERNRIKCRVQSGGCDISLKYVWNGTPCGTDLACYRGRCVNKFTICTSTESSTTTISSTTSSTTSTTTTTSTTITTTSPTSTTTSAPCTCCGLRNVKRKRCCKRGRRKFPSACYCCKQLKGVQPPDGYDGPRP